MFTETLKERQALAQAVPTTINSGATASINTGNGLNMAILRRARAILNVGAITGGGSLNFSLQASATSGGSYSAITNSTTNPTLTGITTANQPNALEIRADQMPTGKPWLRAIVTETGGQNCLVAIDLIGDESEYKPANAQTPSLQTVTYTNDVVTAT